MRPWEGVVPARVTAHDDPKKMGRVRVRFFWQEDGATHWARMLSAHAGPDRGFMFLPEVGDEVAVMFEDGDPERPVVVGALWNGVQGAPRYDLRGEDIGTNEVKRLVTKSGNRLQLSDKPGKETVVLATPNRTALHLTESHDSTGRPLIHLHSDGDIVLSAPNGRVHIDSLLFSREVGTPGPPAAPPAPNLDGLSCVEKMEAVVGLSNIPHAVLEELGGVKGIAAAIVSAVGVYTALQLTPVGWAGDAAAALLAAGLVLSGSQVIEGTKDLYTAWHTACREAKSHSDLEQAANSFSNAVAKIGVNGILLLLDAKSSTRVTRALSLESSFHAHDIPTEKLPSMVSGADLGEAVTTPTLKSGETFDMWVRDGGKPGIWAAPSGTDPESLAIVTKGRHLEVYQVTDDLTVTQSTAAKFEAGSIPDVGGKGGGTQYVLPPDWLIL